jgi:hypothetical protein
VAVVDVISAWFCAHVATPPVVVVVMFCAFAVIIVRSSIAAIDANIIADAVAINMHIFLFIVVEQDL